MWLDLKYIGEYRTVSALLNKKCCYFVRKWEKVLMKKVENILFCDHVHAYMNENKGIYIFIYLNLIVQDR